MSNAASKKRTPEQVDADQQAQLDESVAILKDKFAQRLNAGLPLTLEEWEKMGKHAKEVWEHCLAEYTMKNTALNAHFIADAIVGGTLAVEAVWDILPEEVQNAYQREWSRRNAEQNKPAADRA